MKPEILEGNKLIAEFMGAEWRHKYGFPEQMGYEFKDAPYASERSGGTWWNPDYLEFHTNWQWLMPVCKKIVDSIVNLPTIELRKAANKFHSPIEDGLCNFLIENTWEAAVQFIKWYNQNKTS